MSELIKVIRLSKMDTPANAEGWQQIFRHIQRVAGDTPSWWRMPGPQCDDHPVLSTPIGIERHEMCGVADEVQLRDWWPDWSLNALTSDQSEHDIVLDVYTVALRHVRVGTRQVVFNPDRALVHQRIPLARSSLSADGVREYLTNQNSVTLARFDQMGMPQEVA